jgi:hypothetical protein
MGRRHDLVRICERAGPKEPRIIVTLLGTGSPIPEPSRLAPVSPHDRMNAMTLVRAGQEVLLFDAGRDVVERRSPPRSTDGLKSSTNIQHR